MKAVKLIFVFWIFSLCVYSQPFTYIDAGFSGSMQSHGAWVDFNNDETLDVFITGEKYSGNKQILITKLYTNSGKSTFSYFNSSLPEIYRASADWGDYDKDGDLDLLLCGETDNKNIITNIYRNNGKGRFYKLNSKLIPVRDGSVHWDDYDNDGDLDILLTGESYNENLVSKIYENNGNNTFSPVNVGLEPVHLSSAKWGDYDNDGDKDILLSGQSYNQIVVTRIYKNNGKNNFKALPLVFKNLRMSDVEWCDFNKDGKLDFIICGETFNNRIFTKIYKNIGNDKFKEVTTSIQGVRSGNIDLKDYDCDGDCDVLIAGESYENAITKVYRNDGNFVFTDVYANLPGIYMGAAYWGDYDNDCDKDILLIGLNNCFDYVAKLYRNDGKVAKKKYDLRNTFNNLIVKNVKTWPKVDQGHRVSIGFETKEEAVEARRKVIQEYTDEKFHIRYVEW